MFYVDYWKQNLTQVEYNESTWQLRLKKKNTCYSKDGSGEKWKFSWEGKPVMELGKQKC